MEQELFVPHDHFYSPWPNLDDAKRHLDALTEKPPTYIHGVRLDDDSILTIWNSLLPEMRELPFEDHANSRHRYHFINDFYSYGDATVYYGIIATYKPKRIIEIGSGYSSAVALDAREHLNLSVQLTFIEPYPRVLRSLLRPDDAKSVTLIEEKVQNVDLDHFRALEAGDILFVDSSHVLKTGSDVCFEIFEILPILKPGVIVHFHDVFFPFEYLRDWVLNDKRAWNELYALRAFLMYNQAFDIIFFNHYFNLRFPDAAGDPATKFARNCGGGLWLMRTDRV